MNPPTGTFDFVLYGRASAPWSYDQLLAASQIAIGSAAAETHGLDEATLRALVDEGLLVKEGQTIQFGPRLIYFSHSLIQNLQTAVERHAGTYAVVIREHIERLQEIACRLPFSAGHASSLKSGSESGPWAWPWAWDDIAHTVIAGLLVDLGVLHQLLAHDVISEQPGEYWIWAFEGGTPASSHAFGVQTWRSPHGPSALAQLWHAKTKRPSPLKVDENDVALMQHLFLHGALPEGSQATPQQVLKLTYFKLLKKEDGRYRVNIPVVAGAEGDALCEALAQVTSAIVARAVTPAMAEAEKIFQASGILEINASHRHGFARMLMESALAAVVEARLLPDFPATVPHHWASWMTIGSATQKIFREHG